MVSRLGRWSVIASSLLLVCMGMMHAAGEEDASRRLGSETSLRTTPEGPVLAGLLTAGTKVAVLEKRGDWIRVRLEGWVPATSLQESAPPVPVAQAPVRPVPQAPLTAAFKAQSGGPVQAASAAGFNQAAGAEVDGWIRLGRGFRRKRPGAGARIMLLPPGSTADSLKGGSDQEDRLSEIRSRADQLRKEAAVAMRDSNFTRGINRKDEIMARRRDLIDEQLKILAARNGRREAAARARARAITVADPQGWFHFEAVPAGDYTLYVRLNQADIDLEWLQPVQVTAEPLKLELDESDATGWFPGQE
ncbi:MAG: SH3 domain-containing protein [Acidobacteriota bacterium]